MIHPALQNILTVFQVCLTDSSKSVWIGNTLTAKGSFPFLAVKSSSLPMLLRSVVGRAKPALSRRIFEASLFSVHCYHVTRDVPRLQSSRSTTLHLPVGENLWPNGVSQGEIEKPFVLLQLMKRSLKRAESSAGVGERRKAGNYRVPAFLFSFCVFFVPTMPPMWGAFLGKLSLLNTSTNSKHYQRFFLLSSAFSAFFTASFWPFLLHYSSSCVAGSCEMLRCNPCQNITAHFNPLCHSNRRDEACSVLQPFSLSLESHLLQSLRWVTCPLSYFDFNLGYFEFCFKETENIGSDPDIGYIYIVYTLLSTLSSDNT